VGRDVRPDTRAGTRCATNSERRETNWVHIEPGDIEPGDVDELVALAKKLAPDPKFFRFRRSSASVGRHGTRPPE
jgi:hypothetical protein